MIKFGNIHDEKFSAPGVDTHEDGSATVTIAASVKAEEPTLERVEIRARVENAQAMTLADVQKEGMKRACAILQAAGQALSEQLQVDPEVR